MPAETRRDVEQTLGTTANVIDRSITRGADAVAPLLDSITKAIESADSYERAIEAATEAIASHADDSGLAAMVSAPSLTSDLLGRLTVRTELGMNPEPVKASGAVMLAAGDPVFSDLAWAEAIEAFRKRGIVSDDDLDTLIRDHQAQGVEARALLLETVQKNTLAAIERVMREGTSFADFKKDIQATVIEPLGLTEAEPWYLDTVMRTNVQSAYSAGRTASQTAPEVLDAYPYWRKLVVGDGRTRATHAALVGHVFRHGNEKTDRLRGTLGFNCRCADQPVAASYSGPVTEDVPDGFAFDARWVS